MLQPLIAFGFPGLPEMLIVGAIVLLLFGNRLPKAMGSLGKSIVEFKKGIKGIEEEMTKSEEAAAPPVEKQEHQESAT